MNLFAFLMILFVLCGSALADDGASGAQGANGTAGANGARGSVSLMGIGCAISPNLEHLKMCLDDGLSVNDRTRYGVSIFQAAIQSYDLPMLEMVINNPDPKNKPDLRVRYTRTQPGTPALNTYELILLDRVFESNSGEPIKIDEKKLKSRLYVDDGQVAQLKLILAIEMDKKALWEETQEILNHLKTSRLSDTPSVQNAIKAITDALSN